MKNILYYSLLAILFLNMKCEDTEEDYLPAGIETRVFGNIYDNANQIPVPDQKLIAAEYYRDFRFDGGSYDVFVQELDSTTTDQNGNFDFIFKTGGMGTKYKIYPRHNNLVWTYYQDAVDIENIKGNNELSFEFQNLYVCTLNINMDNLQFPPFSMSVFLTPYSELDDITETNGIVNRAIYLSVFEDAHLNITRKLSDGTRQTATVLIPASNILEPRTFDITLTNSDFE